MGLLPSISRPMVFMTAKLQQKQIPHHKNEK
jgi:hypothetical protein